MSLTLVRTCSWCSCRCVGAGGNVFKEIYKEQVYYVNIKYLHENCFFRKWNCTALVGSNNVSYAFVMYLMNSERQNIFTDIIIIAGLLRVS